LVLAVLVVQLTVMLQQVAVTQFFQQLHLLVVALVVILMAIIQAQVVQAAVVVMRVVG
jgi:hypothetical protein